MNPKPQKSMVPLNTKVIQAHGAKLFPKYKNAPS